MLLLAVTQQAFSILQHTIPKDLAKLLEKWSDLIVEHQETLAELIMQVNGRPIAGARQEIKYAAGFFDCFRGEADRLYGYIASGTTSGKNSR